MADAKASVTSLIAQLQAVADTKDVEQDVAARASLLHISRQLTANLEPPNDAIASLAHSGSRLQAVRVALDLKIFDSLNEQSPRSLSDLASVSGADRNLCRRLLRTLANMGYVQQINGEYSSTNIGRQLLIPSIQAGIKLFADQGPPIWGKASAYFRSNGGCLPHDGTDGPLQFAHNTKDDAYTFFSKQPGALENFNSFMNGRWGSAAQGHWLDWFPLHDKFLSSLDLDKSEYTFIDIGGGKGHEGELILNKYPQTQGRFVLEDFADAMKLEDNTQLHSRIERVAHDFNEPQPIKGARIYFLRSILHNWPTAVCQRILGRLRDVLVPEYSRILIVNMVLGTENVPLRACELDLWMLFAHNGAQRDLVEWSELVEGSGLKIAKFWQQPGAEDSVIEVYLPA